MQGEKLGEINAPSSLEVIDKNFSTPRDRIGIKDKINFNKTIAGFVGLDKNFPGKKHSLAVSTTTNLTKHKWNQRSNSVVIAEPVAFKTLAFQRKTVQLDNNEFLKQLASSLCSSKDSEGSITERDPFTGQKLQLFRILDGADNEQGRKKKKHK